MSPLAKLTGALVGWKGGGSVGGRHRCRWRGVEGSGLAVRR